jgi:Ca2+/H+ antiporter
MTRFFNVIWNVLASSWINVLLVFVPVGIAVHFAGLSDGVVFAMNAIAIVPLAGLLAHATESVAKRLGDTVGALMNVTFGNAVELIIFIIALVKVCPTTPAIRVCVYTTNITLTYRTRSASFKPRSWAPSWPTCSSFWAWLSCSAV